jgi:hypothetical protein
VQDPARKLKWYQALEDTGPENVRAILAQSPHGSGGSISVGDELSMTKGYAQRWLAVGNSMKGESRSGGRRPGRHIHWEGISMQSKFLPLAFASTLAMCLSANAGTVTTVVGSDVGAGPGQGFPIGMAAESAFSTSPSAGRCTGKGAPNAGAPESRRARSSTGLLGPRARAASLLGCAMIACTRCWLAAFSTGTFRLDTST